VLPITADHYRILLKIRTVDDEPEYDPVTVTGGTTAVSVTGDASRR
jgi:hypothetical protein